MRRFNSRGSLLALALLLSSSLVSAQDASVTVIHGIPGLPAPVDVLVDGSVAFSFDFGEQVGPVALPAGQPLLEVQLQGATVLSAQPTLVSGASYTVVAHLQAGGGNTLSLFENDLSQLNPLGGRLVVRHLADAPAVDVDLRAPSTFFFGQLAGGLTNPNQVSANLTGGIWGVRLNAAGTANTAIGPRNVVVNPGSYIAVHAVGQLGTPSFRLITQEVVTTATPAIIPSVTGTTCGPNISLEDPSGLAFGETFRVTASGAAPLQPAFLIAGDRTDQFLSLSLPFDTTSVGAPGCFLYTNILAHLDTASDANGDASFEFLLDPILAAGFDGLYFQWITIDPAANAAGFVLSELLRFDVAPAPELDLRVVHASPDAPAVDVYVKGVLSPIVSDLSYTEATDFLGLPAGVVQVEVRPAGASATSPAVFTSAPLSLSAGQRLTVFAAGLVGSTDPADQFRLIIQDDDAFAATTPGNALVRVLHAAPDAPTVDIDVGDDGSVEIPGLARFANTAAAGVPLPASTALQIAILAGGNRVTAFTATLPEDTVYVVAVGQLGAPLGDSGFELLAIGSNGVLGVVPQNPRVYALHASPDTAAVDLGVGGSLIATGVTFGGLAGPFQVVPGTLTVDVFPSGSMMAVASPTSDTLEAGTDYVLVATGFTTTAIAGEPFQLRTLAAPFTDADPANNLVQIVHNGPDAPAVDVSTLTGGQLAQPPIVAGAAFGDVSGVLTLAPAPTTVGVAVAGSTAPVATFTLPLAAGSRVLALASGALGATGTIEPFRLLLIETSQTPWAVIDLAPNP